MIAGQETSLERAVGASQRMIWRCSVAMSHITQGTGPALFGQRRNPPLLRALRPSPRQDPKEGEARGSHDPHDIGEMLTLNANDNMSVT